MLHTFRQMPAPRKFFLSPVLATPMPRQTSDILDCGDTTPLSDWETCLPVPKRPASRILNPASGLFKSHTPRTSSTATIPSPRGAPTSPDNTGSLAAAVGH